MRVLLAPDKFKGSLSAHDVCVLLSSGLTAGHPDITVLSMPLADGGEGSLDTIASIYPTVRRKIVSTYNAAGQPLDTFYLYHGTQAWVEMAKASGWTTLEPHERHPYHLSTYGTGLLVSDALAMGMTDITIFCGGSATVDGGLGLGMALGYQFLDHQGQPLPAKATSLPWIKRIIHPKPHLTAAKVTMAVDVNNPLTGPDGSALVYGPQKGASLEECQWLDDGLMHLRRQWQQWCGMDPGELPGAGSAGGLAAGGVAFLGAKIKSGADYLLTETKLAEKIAQVDVVITGEGKFDQQSLHGKLVYQIYQLALHYQKPLIIVCGQAGVNVTWPNCKVMALTDYGLTVPETIQRAPELVNKLGQKIATELELYRGRL